MAKGNRKAAEAEALSWIKDIDKSGRSLKYVQECFSKMSDERFEAWILDLENKRDYVSIIMDGINAKSITTENNLAVAKKRGVNFFQKIWIVDPKTKHRYLSGVPYPCLHSNIKVQIETIENKRSIPTSSNKIDELTGQVSGDSGAMTMSPPEFQVLYAMGLEDVITESMKYRGGDIKGNNEYNKSLLETGQVSTVALEKTPTAVKSTQTLHNVLTGMHYDNNL